MEEVTTIETENQAIIDALNSLNENSVATNDSIKELQEYLIIQDNRKQQAQQDQEDNAQIEKEASDLAEQQASSEAEQQAETYTELLTDIKTQIELSNELQSVNNIWFGVIIGLLWIKILFDRLFK